MLDSLRNNRPHSLSIALTVAAIILWIVSLTQSKLELQSGLGLISGLPLSFFIATAILTMGAVYTWTRAGNSRFLMLFQLITLVCMLWLTPIIIGGIGASHQVVYHTYNFWDLSQLVTKHGSIYSGEFYYSWWPTAWIYISSFSQVIGIAGNTIGRSIIVGFSPIVLQFAFILCLYPAIKTMLPNAKNRDYFVAGWFFSLANWNGSADYLSPLGFALVLFILLIAVLFNKRDKTASYYLLFTLLYVTITIMEPAASLTAFIVIFALLLVRKMNWIPVLVAAAIQIGFNFYYTGFITRVILQIGDIFSNPILFFKTLLSQGLLNYSSPEHTLVVNIKLLTTILVLAVVGLGVIAGFASKAFRENNDRQVLWLIGAISATLIIFSFYGREIFQRAYLFAIVLGSYFTVKLVRKQALTIFLCVLCIGLIPLHIISQYGYLSTDYTSNAQLVGSSTFNRYSAAQSNSGIIIGLFDKAGEIYNGHLFDMMGDIVGLPTFSQQYDGRIFEDVFYNNTLHSVGQPAASEIYLAMGRNSQMEYQIVYNDSEYYSSLQSDVQTTPGYNFVYSNPDLSIYTVPK